MFCHSLQQRQTGRQVFGGWEGGGGAKAYNNDRLVVSLGWLGGGGGEACFATAYNNVRLVVSLC